MTQLDKPYSRLGCNFVHVPTFTDAVQRHGRPEAVMNDKGSAFWSWRGISRFTALLTEMGIDQVIADLGLGASR